MATFSGADAMQRFFGAMTGGHNGAWHTGISRSRVIERLIKRWQLHVDDAYKFGGDLIGRYEHQFDSSDDDSGDDEQKKDGTLTDFEAYMRQAKDKGVLPPNVKCQSYNFQTSCHPSSPNFHPRNKLKREKVKSKALRRSVRKA